MRHFDTRGSNSVRAIVSRKIRTIWAIIALALGSVSANAQTNLLTDLGVGTGYGLNNNGQVVLSTGIYNNGTVTPLPTGFSGVAINLSGRVAGTQVSMFFNSDAAFYSNGVVTVIPVNGDPGVASTAALGLNDNGEVVGQGAGVAGLMMFAFIYNNGQITNLGTFSGSNGGGLQIISGASGINDAGQVTGTAINDSNPSVPLAYDAFIYDSKSAALTDLGSGRGWAINTSGQVTGSSDSTGHAFLYSGGKMTDLGSSTTVGYAINTTGQVVGQGSGHAFFYNGVVTDLNALLSASDPLQQFVTLTDALGINDSRLIVVNGVDSRTQLTHAYLLQGPWITLAPGTLSFPSELIGSTRSTQSVTVTNAGTMPLTIGSISVSGNFAQTNSCGASLASSATCDVTVSFKPTAAGSRTGSLTIVSGGTSYAVSLSGTAVFPAVITSLSASPTTITAGQSTTLMWSSTNASSCMATGGGAGDAWSGNKPTSGNATVTESAMSASPLNLSFILTCTSAASGQSGKASAKVIENPAPAKSGGGGSFDWFALILLSGVAGFGRVRLSV